MDPLIRLGAVGIGVMLIAASRPLALARSSTVPVVPDDAPAQPTWVIRYTLVSFGVMLVVGGITVDARWAVVAFVVVLFGMTTYKLIANVKAGGYGGEE